MEKKEKKAKQDIVVSKGGTNKDQIRIGLVELKKAVAVLRALNHPLRQHMIQLLEESKKITVTEIYIKMRLEQSVASQHLAILRAAQIVKTEREGKFIYYGVNRQRLAEVAKLVEEFN